jgi:hypothetical protein
MIEFTVAGKSVDAQGFAAVLEAAALQSIKDQLRERFGAMRNPATGGISDGHRRWRIHRTPCRSSAGIYNWPPRRLNPAMAFLVNRDPVRAMKGLGGGAFSVHFLDPTDDTRRFVSSRDLKQSPFRQ